MDNSSASEHKPAAAAISNHQAIDSLLNNLVRNPSGETKAVRLLLDDIYASTPASFSLYIGRLDYTRLVPGLRRFVEENAPELNAAIASYHDMRYTYAGLKTLYDSYLQRDQAGHLIERPQYMHMRIAVGLFFPRLDRVIQAYQLFAMHLYTHATPTLFNCGLQSGGYASCFLLEPRDDLENIFSIIRECASISKMAGGVGINLGRIRARGSRIRRTNGKSDGIIPLIQVINSVARYVTQGGRRNGAMAVYIEPWHADIMDFLNLRRNTGQESLKARDVFTGLWVPDLFMQRVQDDGMWPLFCPSSVPELAMTFGSEFDDLFHEAERQQRYMRILPARDIWKAIIESQIETGTPYILFKDTCNYMNNLAHLGPVRCSNLCAEVILPVGKHWTSVCNLASINLAAFVSRESEGEFDFAALSKTVKFTVDALNAAIDRTIYPSTKASNSNFLYRPIGIGIQGLAGVFMTLGLPWTSNKAKELNTKIMAEIYLSAYEQSVELARLNNPYPAYANSPLALYGIMHHDSFEKADQGLKDHYPRLATLRENIRQYGVYNSTLTALMPTASTSILLGNVESFEPITSNLFQRNTQSGFFTMFNSHLVKRARELDMFDESFIETVIRDNGSVKNTTLPQSDKDVFATIWEIPQRVLVDMAADRAPFVDMSQSMNLYFEEPTYQKITSALFRAWQCNLKTGCYYLRTRPATTAAKEAVLASVAQKAGGETRGCNGDVCVSCTA